MPDTVRETVAAVAEAVAGTVADGADEGVMVVAVASRLHLDKSTAWRRVRVAINRGYLRNLATRRGQAARIVLGEPLPGQQTILPERAELERLHGCTPLGGDTQQAVVEHGSARVGGYPSNAPTTVQPPMSGLEREESEEALLGELTAWRLRAADGEPDDEPSERRFF